MNKQVISAEERTMQYKDTWQRMKDDLIGRQGNINTLSEKERALSESRGSKAEIDRILHEIKLAQKAMYGASSVYFIKLREIIDAVTRDGQEEHFWTCVTKLQLEHAS
jgi:hypothetical protein